MNILKFQDGQLVSTETIPWTADSLRAAIAQARWERSQSGCAWEGRSIRTTEDDKTAITQAVVLAQTATALGQPFSVQWKLPTGFIELTASQVVSLGLTVGAFIQQWFAWEASLVARIQAGESLDQVAQDAGV